ncbi:MAG: hypothetical protein AAGA91_01080 [Pseudomonadota bacterium]
MRLVTGFRYSKRSLLSTVMASFVATALLGACSGVEIDPAPTESFAAGQYTYYKWRTDPLPATPHASDPVYILDPVMRRSMDKALQAKGYVLDTARAQFSVDYLYAPGLIEGEQPDQASNISAYPGVNPNRQIDQARVDNAIALGGLKETNNMLIQFNDVATNREVWQVMMTKIVENANQINEDQLNKDLGRYVDRALSSLPNAAVPTSQ